MSDRAGGRAGSHRDPRAFAHWFLNRELGDASGSRVVVDRALAHLERALTHLDLGRIRAALDEANLAARLSPELRSRALLVARLCVLRELAHEPAAAMNGGF